MSPILHSLLNHKEVSPGHFISHSRSGCSSDKEKPLPRMEIYRWHQPSIWKHKIRTFSSTDYFSNIQMDKRLPGWGDNLSWELISPTKTQNRNLLLWMYYVVIYFFFSTLPSFFPFCLPSFFPFFPFPLSHSTFGISFSLFLKTIVFRIS